MSCLLPAAAYLLPDFAGEEFFAQLSVVLLMLAGAVLVYRTFREKYLLAWILGWVAYLVHKFAAGVSAHGNWLAFSHAAYVLAIALFAGAVFLYTDSRRLLLPLAIFTVITLDVAVIRAVWFPGSHLLTYLLFFGMYTVIRGAPAVRLALSSRGRSSLGPWVLVFSLVLLHIHEDLRVEHMVPGYDLFLEILLGLSMLLIVLDESQERSRRLGALNAITAAIAQARSLEPILDTALQQLKRLTGARGAWFRLLEGNQLVLARHAGVSERYVKERHALEFSNSFSGRVIHQGKPAVITAASADAETRQRLREEGFNHVIVAPVEGKNSIIGSLALGMAGARSYRPDEMRFLGATANQLGIAVESLRLFDQILSSQKQWASTFDSIDDAILVHDQQFRIIKVNRALLNRLGRPHTEVIHNPCEEALPREREAWAGCPYCWRVISKFGEAADPCFGGFSQVSTSSYSEEEGGLVGTIHIIKDITEHRAAEERYRRFFEQMQEGVFVATPDGHLLDCNDAFVRLLGYSSHEELLPLDIGRDLYAEPEERAEFARLMAEQGFVRHHEVTLRRKDGSTIAALETSFATRDVDGKIIRYQGFLLDMTEKKRAEDAIRHRNRELFALNSIAVVANQSFDLEEILDATVQQVVNLFSADTGAVFLFDERAKVLRRRAARGHRGEMGAGIDEVRIPEDFLERLRQSRTQVITQQHLSDLPGLVGEFVRQEGMRAWIWVLLWTQDKILGVLGISSRTAREFTASDENLLTAIGRQLATTIDKVRLYEETRRAYEDLTRTQEQLLQSEKMSAVGQLISGVAHELNNPLTAILGYSQLLENEGLNPRAADFLQKLYKQTQRTHRIVQNLLSFSRQRKPMKQLLDIRQVLENTLALRDYDLRLNNIEVIREVQPGLPQIVGDGHQLEQVFLNIINNAVDAMLEVSKGGRLGVRVFQENAHICAEFHDSGPGLKDPKRIFDPFYTTKSVGKGTGLGLSICYGIVKEHGGEILARNHPQGGAVLQVRLPAAAEPARVEPQPQPRPEIVLHGRVLLVDDEEAVLDLEREALSGAGAEVVALLDGKDAISRLEKECFDGIIIDGKMPGGWTGIDIYRWVLANRPGLEKNIMLAVSDVVDPELRRFIEESGVLCIPKPFEVHDLIAMTRRLLEKSRTVTAP